jgi:5-methyltetrahydrofolate--homocysteine methyltransferase
MNRTTTLLSRLDRGALLLADGACGTLLQGKGLEAGKVPEAWLFDREEQIYALHREYVQAGSEIILTCSFGGTRFRLESDGLDNRVVEVNRRAARIARKAAGDLIFVAGDMGPTGQLLAPLGSVTSEQMADAYAEQVQGLVDGGIDLLLIETMSDVGEAQAAVEGARRVTDLPILCTFSFDSHGRTMMGVSPQHAARELGPLVEGIGANCGRDPDEYVGIIQAMRSAAPATILWAKPNAGLPRVVDGDVDQVVYDATPEYMARVALQLREAGAQVIGGCCGTTPAHIRAMAAALRGRMD